MHNIIGNKSLRWIAGGALMVFASLSHAQYLWLNEKGAKVYSDRPPPTSVPLKNILKSPGSAGKAAMVADEAPAADAPAAAPAAKGPPTLAERNIDFRKRQAEKAEQEKKDLAAAQQKEAQRKNCETARSYQRTLDSGERIGQMAPNGERSFMSDSQRADAQASNNKVLQDCGK